MNLYIIRNQQGQFFRPVGYGGSGRPCWVDSLDKAKFYAKMGQAKSRVTSFARESAKYGTPDILEFTLDVAQAKTLDMREYAKGALNKIEKRRLEHEKQTAQWELDRLQADQDRINQRIKELKP